MGVADSNLREPDDDGTPSRAPRAGRPDYHELPDALECFEDFAARLAGRKPAFFLDFDGTLSSIVSRPADAVLLDGLRETLRKLAQDHVVAIISGRDRADVQQRVGLDELVYAGSHGMDISGPGGLRMLHEAARACLADIDAAEQALRARLQSVPGAEIERKRFAVAVHFRNVAAECVPDIDAAVEEARARWPSLRRTGGKKVFELRPDVDWDKGRAVLWLLDALKLKGGDVVPVYFGDDLTDEDAFRALADSGVTVLVGDHGKPTTAGFRVADPAAARELLDRLLDRRRAR